MASPIGDPISEEATNESELDAEPHDETRKQGMIEQRNREEGPEQDSAPAFRAICRCARVDASTMYVDGLAWSISCDFVRLNVSELDSESISFEWFEWPEFVSERPAKDRAGNDDKDAPIEYTAICSGDEACWGDGRADAGPAIGPGVSA